MTPFAGTNRVTSPFGWRTHPISGKREMHEGQDIVTDGQAYTEPWMVREVTGGKVLRVTSDQWRGKYVDVETASGVFERYQHMERIDVKVGDKVEQGHRLGLAGTTGDSTGIHLHFGVYVNGTAVDPSQWSGVPNAAGNHPGNNNVDNPAPAPAPAPAPSDPFPGVSDEQLAARVWAGEFGNGDARKAALGSRYNAVQVLVDKGVGKPVPTIVNGSKVRVRQGAKFEGGVQPIPQVYSTVYTVMEPPVGDRVVIGLPGHGITGAFKRGDLFLA